MSLSKAKAKFDDKVEQNRESFQQFLIGTERGRYKILLLGQSGSGKTTFLNLLGNLAFFGGDDVQLRENLSKIKPICRMSDECQDAMQSATQKPGVYQIQLAHDLRIDVVDTPGMGDVRGVDKDEQNVNAIMEMLNRQGHLNCVMLIINGAASRLDPQLAFVISELAAMMPKQIMSNVVVLFTNSQGQKDCTFIANGGLHALEEHGVTDPTCYYINNPFPLTERICQKCKSEAAGTAVGVVEKDSDSSDDEDSDFEQMKSRAVSTFKSLTKTVEVLATLRPVPTNEFIKLYNVRMEVEQRCANIRTKLHALERMIEKISNAQERLRSGGFVEETIEVEEWEFIEIENKEMVWETQTWLPQACSCMHEGCHCNCGTTEIGTLPPGHFLSEWISNQHPLELKNMLNQFEARSVEDFLVQTQFGPLWWNTDNCPICGHSRKEHQTSPMHWKRKLANSVVLVDRSAEIPQQIEALEQEKSRITTEVKEEQQKLGVAVAAQEEHGLWGNCLRLLEIRLTMVQERLKQARGEPDPLLVELEAELKAKIETIQKLHTFHLSTYRMVYRQVIALADETQAWATIEEFFRTSFRVLGSNDSMVATFMIDLRAEVQGWITSHPSVPVTAALVCLLTWTSGYPLIPYLNFGSKEYCFVQNDVMRKDLLFRNSMSDMEPLARITKTLDTEYLALSSGSASSLASGSDAWRGLTMPLEELQANYKKDVKYRVPFQLAFSLDRSVSDYFLNRASTSSGKVKVQMHLTFDWANNPPCLNACLLPYSLETGEAELLFQSYSWFMVKGDPSYDLSRSTWVVEIQAGYSNKDPGTDGLPLIYWS